MRIPVPRNRLVALTLLGIALTGVLTVVLANPSVLGDDRSEQQPSASQASVGASGDVPTPNPNFTPAVQQQSAYEDHEEHEYEEHEDDDHERWEDDD